VGGGGQWIDLQEMERIFIEKNRDILPRKIEEKF
jgi:hypothetical protein